MEFRQKKINKYLEQQAYSHIHGSTNMAQSIHKYGNSSFRLKIKRPKAYSWCFSCHVIWYISKSASSLLPTKIYFQRNIHQFKALRKPVFLFSLSVSAHFYSLLTATSCRCEKKVETDRFSCYVWPFFDRIPCKRKITLCKSFTHTHRHICVSK